MSRRRCHAAGLAAALLIAGCATPAPEPPPVDPEARAERLVIDEVIVDIAVLGRAETIRELGVDLEAAGVQPVWIRIVNTRDAPVWLAPLSIDQDYWAPMEVAFRLDPDDETEAVRLRRLLVERAAPVIVDAGATGEGLVYTHPDEGLKPIRVHLLGLGWDGEATTVLRVPGASSSRDFAIPVPPPGLPSIGLGDLQAWLAGQPCCTLSATGVPGDPLNIVLVGSGTEVLRALVDTRWDVALEDDGTARARLIRAFLTGSRERYAPVSPLFLYGRRGDLAFQKAREVVDQRNHLRLWRAPVLVEGREVWLGQISRDVGIKLTARHWPPITHVIDPAVDEARFYLMQDLLLRGHLATVGFAAGAPRAPSDAPTANAEGDPYFSDGLRAILVLSPVDVRPRDTTLLSGELPGPGGTRIRFPPVSADPQPGPISR
jgi:hypothetical protein